MFAAFITTIFFSLSAIFASRSSRILGVAVANLGRMTGATLMLAIWAHTFGQGLRGASLPWFLVSGFIGYGLGDVALFQAFTRIGPRLTMMLVHCLAVPIAAVIENIWLGTSLRPAEIVCACVILGGVCIALTPVRHLNLRRNLLWSGVFFGACAGFGQGFSAVISRKAYAVAVSTGLHIDGGTAGYQRILGGIVVAAGFMVLTKGLRWNVDVVHEAQALVHNPQLKSRAWMFVALNGLAGPVLGVACFQWALSMSPSGIVLPILAVTPVVTIPLTYLIDGDRPSMRSMVGGVIAVGGTVALALAKASH